MTKGKYKRKKQHAQQQANASSARTIVVEQTEATVDKGEASAKSTPKPPKNKNPSRWQRFTEWVKRDKTFTDWCLALFTFFLAAAAIYQFIIMGGQLDVMRIDQRAWIVVRQKDSVTIALNEAPSTTLKIENTGKTPAVPVVGDPYVEIVPNGNSPHFDASVMHRQHTYGMLAPNGSTEVLVSRLNNAVAPKSEDLPLTNAEYADLDNGNAWIAVYGKVGYRDVFGTKHWTAFCFWSHVKRVGDYSAASCARYNEVDHNK